MKLPEIENAQKYTGMYVVDFGESSSVGFTADEVAELLDSEQFADVKVYRICNAFPDGKMELKGVTAQTFQLEMGMFFYAGSSETAKGDYKRLIDLAVTNCPPGRAKVHHSKLGAGSFVTALIYPAEYNDEFSQWLLDGNYKTSGAAQGGIGAVQEYYDRTPEVIEKHQLFGKTQFQSRTGDELLVATKLAVQR